MDEVSLIQAAQRGDVDAFNHLVLAYQEVAYNVAWRLLDDADAAQDATQSAFITAYKSLGSYRGGSFRAWVLRMVTNTCYDELRRRKRRPTVPLEPVDDESNEEIESPAWMADDAPTPEDRVETGELENAIQNCLNNLPDEFRSVIVMVDVQGLDYQEASEAIRTPLGTVKSRLARARLRMRDCLQSVRELLPSQFRLEDEGSL
jgi:RNA polymerase sigma-70 factor (ECF subfamily)